MPDTLSTVKEGEADPRAGSAWVRWLLPNIILAISLVLLGAANAAFHMRFPVVVAWLPAGLALATVLLYGPRLLPGIMFGTFAMLLVVVGEPVAALLSALANTVGCAFAWGVLRLGKPIDYAQLRVSCAGRILLTGCLTYGAMAFCLGPYATSHLIKHTSAAHAIQAAPAAMYGHAAKPHATPQAHPPHGHDTAHSPHGHNMAPAPVSQHAQHTGGHGSMPETASSHGAQHSSHAHAMPHADVFEWLLTDAIGILLMAPLLFYFGSRQPQPTHAAPAHHRGAIGVIGAIGALAGLVAVAWSIYSGYLENNFGIVHTTLLVLPPAVWLALEYDLGYTLIGNFAVMLIAGIGTGFGYGPFKDHTTGLPLLTSVFALTTLLIAASRTERRVAEHTIYQLATRDTLTGIANRSFFGKRMEQALYGARRYNRKVAVMFIDLNYFKKINDTLGHEAGDKLLVQVAQRIHACMRADSMLARFGGDEFVILVDHVNDANVLTTVAERVIETVSKPYDINGQACHIACAIGISIYPDDGASMSELMCKADAAMYRAKANVKSSGKNGVQFATAPMLDS